MPISPPPILGSGRQELPAYVANGVVGLRVRDVPLTAGMALLSGYTGEHHERLVEAAAPAPYPIAGDIALDGVWLSDTPQNVSDLEQAYDFAAGELTTRFTFATAVHSARIEVLTFCCRQSPSLICQEVKVEVEHACDLGLRAAIDAATADGRALRHSRDTPGETEPAVDGSLHWESAGALSTCGLAMVTELLGAGKQSPIRPPLRDRRLVSEYQIRARASRAVRLRQIVSVIPHRLHRQPDQQAVRLVAKARVDGFDALRSGNRDAWSEIWRGRIVLKGAEERWQALADAAVFYLNTSAHPSSPASTSIFGLATWHDYHYYFGHVMWDIEAFAIPPLSLLQPQAAEALLAYRADHLAGARSNARLHGRRGLQFPWESAPGAGEECAPLPGAAAWHEDHVSLDVARAFGLYADITGDLEFSRNRAWPVLSGVAEWLTSRVTKTAEGYDIAGSMGIAEREVPVNNAAFTNMAAVVVLMDAIRLGEHLNFAVDPRWRVIAQGIAIPKRAAAIVSHDGYRTNEEKGATPDPLMGLFPLGYPATAEEEAATLALYLKAADDYIGSPMLSALYGAWAARTGDRVLALKLLDEGYAQFSADRFMQIVEYRPDRFPEQPQAGPFFANIGGFLTGLLFGFTRLKPGPGSLETWSQARATLPIGWTSIEVERIWVRGRPMRLLARHGELTKLTPCDR